MTDALPECDCVYCGMCAGWGFVADSHAVLRDAETCPDCKGSGRSVICEPCALAEAEGERG